MLTGENAVPLPVCLPVQACMGKACLSIPLQVQLWHLKKGQAVWPTVTRQTDASRLIQDLAVHENTLMLCLVLQLSKFRVAVYT